jgi:hypothetical protein
LIVAKSAENLRDAGVVSVKDIEAVTPGLNHTVFGTFARPAIGHARRPPASASDAGKTSVGLRDSIGMHVGASYHVRPRRIGTRRCRGRRCRTDGKRVTDKEWQRHESAPGRALAQVPPQNQSLVTE